MSIAGACRRNRFQSVRGHRYDRLWFQTGTIPVRVGLWIATQVSTLQLFGQDTSIPLICVQAPLELVPTRKIV